MTYSWFSNPELSILTPPLILSVALHCLWWGRDPYTTSAPAPLAGETPVSTSTATSTPAPTSPLAVAVTKRLKIASINPHAETYDPALTTVGSGAFQFRMMYESLTRLDQWGEVVPNLATSWEISPDFRTHIFHLKKGV